MCALICSNNIDDGDGDVRKRVFDASMLGMVAVGVGSVDSPLVGERKDCLVEAITW